eukprot:314628_1
MSGLEAFYYFAIPYLGICLLVATFVCTASYCQLCCVHASKKANKIIADFGDSLNLKPIFRNTHLFCITTSVLCIAMDWSKFIVCGFILNTGGNIWPSSVNQYYAAADGFYYAGSISFYVIAFLKPYDIFRNTKYEIKSYIYCLFTTFILISAITAIYYVFAVVYFIPFFRYDIPAIIILTVNDFILNTGLMILFVSKLRTCLFELHHVSGDINNIKTISQKWGDLITKHTLLFTISILTNQFFLLSIIVSFATTDSFGWYWTSFRGTENLANVIVLYLSLAMNTRKYKCLCDKCHKRVKKCFMHKSHVPKAIASMTQELIAEDVI